MIVMTHLGRDDLGLSSASLFAFLLRLYVKNALGSSFIDKSDKCVHLILIHSHFASSNDWRSKLSYFNHFILVHFSTRDYQERGEAKTAMGEEDDKRLWKWITQRPFERGVVDRGRHRELP